MRLTDETALRRRLHEALDLAEVGPVPVDAVFRRSRAVRSRRLGAVLSGAAVIAVALGLLVIGVPGPSGGHGRFGVTASRRIVTFSPGGLTTLGGLDAFAVGGAVIYVATGDHPGAELAAYDRTTGHLVGRISVPAVASAVRIGPGGRVWLAFYPDQSGGGTGIWLLSPDLSRRSVLNLGVARYHGAAPFDVLPTGPDSALLATDQGLATVRLPPPGSGGQAALRWAAPSAIPSMPRFGLPTRLDMVAGKTLVQQVHAGPANSTLSFAGHARPVSHLLIGSVVSQGDGLWGITGGPTGMLIRLNSRLRPITPRSVIRNPLLADPVQILTHGTRLLATQR
ncbi:MAG: hypothetical protein ABSB01_27170 [Streptosporangiaceae bacterium]